MGLFNVFSRDTHATMDQVDAPTSTQACQRAASKLRRIYPRMSLAQIASKLYAHKVGRTNFGGRPRIYE